MGGYLKPYGGQRKVGQRPRGGIFFNGIVWRFIPGVVAGYMLNTFFAGRETRAAKKGEPASGGGKTPMKIVDVTEESKLKMVLVVRCDLDMGVGKIGAQCGHASVGAYKRLMRTQHKPLVTMWERGGAAKIVVRCKDQRELMELEDAAGLQRLPTFKVSDAGHTQVAAGSVTVLAIGPGPVDAIDAVTGRLKLL